MSCWETLGLAPTTDLAQIRLAFSERSKQCHPEDDPEGFAALRAAYKTACKLVKAGLVNPGAKDGLPAGTVAITLENGEVIYARRTGPPAGQAGPHTEETPPAAPKPAAPPNATLPPAAEETAAARGTPSLFGGLDEAIEAQQAQSKKVTDAFLSRVARLYSSDRGRWKPAPWRELFARPEFETLCLDELFTGRMLGFFEHNRRLSLKVWNEGIRPTLDEWQLHWNGTEYWNRFEAFHQSAFTKEFFKSRTQNFHLLPPAVRILAPVLAVALVASVAVVLVRNNLNAREEERRQKEQQLEALSQMRELMDAVRYPRRIPGLALDYDAIDAEIDAREEVRAAAKAGLPFAVVSESAAALGVPEDIYRQVQALYTEGQILNAAALLDEYRPVERAQIQQHVHPLLKETVMNGGEAPPAMATAFLALRLEMRVLNMDELVQGYTEHGEAWLDEALLQFDRFYPNTF